MEKNKKIKKEIKKQKIKEAKSSWKELEKLIDYKYNENGELVHKTTGKKCQRLNHEEYELVGMYVKEYVEKKIINTFNLTPLYVPNNKSENFTKRDESQAQCKILISKDFDTNPKCLMLIQGTGAVRLGQWARSVCINDNLEIGSMIPYVAKAFENKFSVIIFNPNERYDLTNDNKIIEDFNSMESHCLYVYKNIVKKNKNIKDIYIVAHSMGGECTNRILVENKEDLISGKIKKIAFTDSFHCGTYQKLGEDGLKKFREISRNYVRSDEEVGKFIENYKDAKSGVDSYSSGHEKHEYTSGYAIREIFDYFK